MNESVWFEEKLIYCYVHYYVFGETTNFNICDIIIEISALTLSIVSLES